MAVLAGPLLFALVMTVPTPDTMPPEAKAVMAVTLWMALWWITEAIPIPVTSLLPVVLFPLTGGLPLSLTTTAYGHPIIFLFIGGFLIATAMERWGLHKRIALEIIIKVGTNTATLILGFMVASAFLSMWISNTAATLMMTPIGLATILHMTDGYKQEVRTSFGKTLMLSLAYASSIGGIATLIGTPTNVILAGMSKDILGLEIGFARWMLFGIPLSIVLLVLCWLYLVYWKLPKDAIGLASGRKVIRQRKEALGRMSYEEKGVALVFILTATAWVTRGFLLQNLLPGLDDTIIAVVGAVLLFIIPSKADKSKALLDWDTAVRLPWGIILLFGGGLAIASAFGESGLAQWIGQQLSGLSYLLPFLLILIVVAVVNLLTEITSNVATASMILPILGALGLSVGIHPLMLMVAASIAASCAFMLPVATPPNAIVFSSGFVSIRDMAKTGMVMNIISIIVTTLMVWFCLAWFWQISVFGFSLS